jgi:hypothetical protein
MSAGVAVATDDQQQPGLAVLLLDEAVGKRVGATGRRFEGSLRGGVAAGLLGRGGECPVAVELEQVVARVE